MKSGKVFFHPIDGSASMTISWSSGPKGNAIEAIKGAGVGFFSDSGHLLCVIFDEVQATQDHQTLAFSCICVEVTVKNGRVTHTVSEIASSAVNKKSGIRRRKAAKKSLI